MGNAASAVSGVGRSLQQGVQGVMEAPMLAANAVMQAGERFDQGRRNQGGMFGDLVNPERYGKFLEQSLTLGLKGALVDDPMFRARAEAERAEKNVQAGLARADEARQQNEMARTRDQQLARARGMTSPGRRSSTVLTSVSSSPRANKTLIGQ